MNYPFWDVAIGYGVLMAAVAVIHVFISHFAIGGGLYLVIAEHGARKANDSERLAFLERLSKLFVLVTVVAGALTGVGIWFIIGLLNPGATEILIHNFVWGWAIEWTFFITEIAAAIFYYYGWRRMSARDHLILGWIYFAAAWLSLFVINGILTFMLTPGAWLASGDFWDGFFNPTFWPSLVLRTGICLMLAGLYAMLVTSRYPGGDFRARMVRYNAGWGLAGLLLIVPSFAWYWQAIPEEIISAAQAAMATPIISIHTAYWMAALIAGGLLFFGMLVPRKLHTVVAVALMAVGLGFFGGFEWFRESLRKPFVITGYMYGNGLEVAKSAEYERDGYLKHIAFRTGDDRADLFRHVCRSCHTLNGYKALAPAFAGADQAFIAAIVGATGALKGNMPPFHGTEAEAESIAAYIYGRIDQRHVSEIYGLSGVALGEKVYELRCGKCHVVGGFNDKSSSLAGLEPDEAKDFLEMAGDMSEDMPAFTGDDVEADALARYVATLGQGEGDDTSGL